MLVTDLKSACADEWTAYTTHPFVEGLAKGTLPETAFRHYLIQDYLFLIHFARAYALAAYKAETLDDIRQATEGLKAIVDEETALHVSFCEGWGVSEAEMVATPEHPATLAYTRFVLETGLRGDLLDLHVALAPCMVGYAEIGKRLATDPQTVMEGNPYRPWIDMYAADAFQTVAGAEVAYLDALYKRRAGPGRDAALIDIFRTATRLEIEFWQMSL